MEVSTAILSVVFIGLGSLAALLIYRLLLLRRGGAAALVRNLPVVGDRGWHHGLVRYAGDTLHFYRLSSLRVGPDLRVSRQAIEVVGRRSPRDGEVELMTAGTVILAVQADSRELEFAFDLGAFTAFMSWVESRPAGNSRRQRPI